MGHQLVTRSSGPHVSVLAPHDASQVCRQGEELNSDQCKLLQLLNMKTSVFELTLVAGWTSGNFERFTFDE